MNGGKWLSEGDTNGQFIEPLIITFQTDDSDFGNDEDSEDDVQTLI